MERDEQLIWDYLDGELSGAKQVSVDERLQNDVPFRKLYETQLQLHRSLHNMDLTAAPENILSNVLVGIKHETIHVAKPTSFSGVKNVAVFSIILTFCLIIFGIVSNDSGVGEPLLGGQLDNLMPTIDYSTFLEGLSLPSQSIVFYGSAIALLLLIYWIDEIYSRLTYVKMK